LDAEEKTDLDLAEAEFVEAVGKDRLLVGEDEVAEASSQGCEEKPTVPKKGEVTELFLTLKEGSVLPFKNLMLK
jgi:hypothetical protein